MARFYTQLVTFRTALIFASICLGETLFFPANLASQTCGCTNCPQDIQDFSTVDLLVQVANAANPTLGQNGQGVCGVILNFDHEYLGDLTIKLTSPAGQTVTLIGPEGFWGPTTFSEWNITFLPCGTMADPDGGFTPKWNSDQGWGSFGNYSGSYYPLSLCLENLNFGPVNGTWKLTVKDAQENDTGIFYDYQILFCDPTGVACQTCVADAGNFLQPDVVACEGSGSLDLNLPPTFAPGQTAPPNPEYSYQYIIAGNGGVIQAYVATPDLTSLPAGSYTVCGMSYLTAQAAQIPAPNGVLTTQQLATSLNSATPPFCGNTTPNCVNVTIHPVPPNTSDTIVVCYPSCYIFGGDTLCNSGVYTDTLMQNGCLYVSTIHLLIEKPDTVQVYEAICENECSATPGFTQNCTSGVFQKTFQSAAGCDSTVILTLNVLNVVADIAFPDTLYCNKPTVPLSGVGSSTGPDVTYSWTTANGGKIAGPTDGLNAVANAQGTYQLKVCRTDPNGFMCCDSTTVAVVKSKAPPPVPGAIIGQGTLCLGQSATYSIPSVPGASTYTWVVPPNVIIQSGQGDTSIVLLWNSATPSVICVTASDSCGNTSASKCRTILVGQVAPPASVPQGLAKVCADSVGTYQVTPLAGATAYEWAINAPHAILTGQNTPTITVAWGNAPTAQICVKVTNSCGTSPAGCATVQVGFSPVAPVLSGDTTVCRNDTVTYAFPPISGAESYTWAGTGGTLLNGQGTNNIQVVWDGATSTGSVCASAKNKCGDSPVRCLNISISTKPVLGPVVRSCDPADLNYFVSFKVTGGTAPFTVAGGTVTNGVFTSNPIPNSTPYQFVITDANGCFSTTIKGNYDCNCISKAGQLNPKVLAACEGGMVTAQLSGAVKDPNDATIFVLHSDSTAALGTIFAQNATGVFGIQNGMTYGVRYFITHIVGNNLNGLPDPTDPCYEMSNAQPVIFYKNPVANAGADLVSCGNTATLTASGTGQWAVTLQPLGGNLLVNNLKNPVTGITASETGRYVLTWTVVSAAGCIGQDMVEAQFNAAPMLGNLTRVCDIANQNYVVMFDLNGGTLPYTVNGNLLIGNVFTSTQFANNQLFAFTVADSNGCALPIISGSYDCNCTSYAGTMQPQPLEVCADAIAQAQANQDLQPDADDVIGFALHDGSGPTLGTVFARNTSGAFSFLPGMTYGKTYYISRMAGNSLNGLPNPLDPCFSVATGQPVIFYEKPVPHAGRDTAVCGQTYVLQAIKSNFDGVWSFVNGPGPAIFSSPVDHNTTVQVLMPGTFVFQWSEQNHGCVVADNVQVVFNPMPELANLSEVCNSTNTGYFIQFDMATGAAPFSIAGVTGNFAGSTFTSSDLLNNTGYLFTVADANGCNSPDNFGSHNCVCTTDVGTMQVIPPTTYCAGETVYAIWNNNAMLDADDAVEFILHDQPGSLVGNIVARNTQPVFAWQPAFQSGVVYYISAIAGNAVNGTVNLADKCLSVTPGVPVFWKALPSVTLDGIDTICAGNTALLSVMGSGAFPLKLTYSDGTSLFDVPLTGPQVVTLLVSPTVTTTYQLIAAEDATNPVCATPLMDAFTVVVNQPLSAGTPNGPLALCEGEEWPVQLSNLLTDADLGGTWTETSANPAPSGNFNAVTGTLETKGLPVGIYQFRYTLTSASPCLPDTSEVEIAINRLPDAEAGENKALNCAQFSVLLDGSSTSGNADFTWLFGSDTVGITPQIFAQDSGRYVLVVTNQFGCTATDSVRVTLANQPPKATFMVRGVRCFGDVNGLIAIDSILVGEFPIMFSIDGAPFRDQKAFGPLVPGPHTVTLLDANGCEWTSDTLWVQQPPDFIAELGPDVEVHLGDSVTLGVDISYPPVALKNIVWKPLLDTLFAGKTTQHFLPLNSLKVMVEVTDTAGCKASDGVQVRVSRDRRIFIPNIIAPQSSENNIALIYGGDDVVEIESFQIFDRWGDLIFSRQHVQPNDKQQGWNGTTNGQDVQPGVYVYQAQIRFADGQSEAFFGSVTVVR